LIDRLIAGNLVSFLTLQFFNLIGYEFTGVSIQSANNSLLFVHPVYRGTTMTATNHDGHMEDYESTVNFRTQFPSGLPFLLEKCGDRTTFPHFPLSLTLQVMSL